MPDIDGHSVIDLTTVGRATGKPHRIEIWFARHEDTLYLLSGGGDRSDWVKNLQQDPEVVVHAGGVDMAGRARVVDDPAEMERARTVVFDKYQPGYGGDLTGWRDRSLPVAIDVRPQPEPAEA